MGRTNKKQIELEYGFNKKLEGKIIEKVSFINSSNDTDINQLIITFTDGTYIHVSLEYDEYNDSPIFDNGDALGLEYYNITPELFNVFNNKLKFVPHLQCQIDMGIIEGIPQEELDNIIEKYNMKQYQLRYRQYLELKKEFE